MHRLNKGESPNRFAYGSTNGGILQRLTDFVEAHPLILVCLAKNNEINTLTPAFRLRSPLYTATRHHQSVNEEIEYMSEVLSGADFKKQLRAGVPKLGLF